MIKIVKVNSYILTSCSWILYNLMPPSRTMNQQCEWKHRCVEQEMVTNITKRRQSLSFSFSGVVQRYSGDDLSICLPTALTKLVSFGGRSETGAIPTFHRWQEWLRLVLLIFFFVMAKQFTHWDTLIKLKECFIRLFLCWTLQYLQMKPSFINTGPGSF